MRVKKVPPRGTARSVKPGPPSLERDNVEIQTGKEAGPTCTRSSCTTMPSRISPTPMNLVASGSS